MSYQKVIAILHNIRSAHNVGSIFRTADAAGISKIYLCGYTPIPETRGRRRGSDKISKTSLGAEKSVSWEYCSKIDKLIENLKGEGFIVAALEQSRKSVNLFDFKTLRPLAIVVGNEVKGLSPAVTRRSDTILELPMRGKKESLNVSVAFGIAVYYLIYKK